MIDRELRLGARRGKTYWGRVGAAATGAVVFFSVMTAQLAIAPPASAGRVTFRVLAWLAALLVAGTVVRLTAETFAREKRENTLGLLFLTPLTPVDLVSGQLVASSFGAFYQFVALIPLLALPVLVGGVTLENFLLLVLSLGNLAFIAASVGLHASAGAWDEKRSTSQATVVLTSITVLLPIALLVIGQPSRAPAVLPYVLWVSPAFPVWQATVSGAATSPGFWISLALTHGMGWLFFRSACVKLRDCWQQSQPHDRDAATSPDQRSIPQLSALETVTKITPVRRGSSSPGRRRIRWAVRVQFDALNRQMLLDQNPVLWLAQRHRRQSNLSWILCAAGPAVTLACGMFGSPHVLLQPGWVLFTAVCVNAGLKLHVAAEAALALARDRAEDTLQLLLATPISPAQLVQGHLQTILQPLGKWLTRIAVAEGIWMAIALLNAGGDGSWVAGAILAGMVALLVPDVRAVAWDALWQGVVAKDSRYARSNAVVHVLVTPWLLLVLVTLASFRLLDTQLLEWIQMATFFGASVAADLWFTRRAQRRLHALLPNWALRRAEGNSEHFDGWRALGRWFWGNDGGNGVIRNGGHPTFAIASQALKHRGRTADGPSTARFAPGRIRCAGSSTPDRG